MDYDRPHHQLLLRSAPLDGPWSRVGAAPQNQERRILLSRSGAAVAGTKRRWRFRADLNGHSFCIAGVELHARAQSLAAWAQVSYTNTACQHARNLQEASLGAQAAFFSACFRLSLILTLCAEPTT